MFVQLVIEFERLAFGARFPLEFADLAWLDACLIKQEIVKRLVTRLSGQRIMRRRSKRFGDELLLVIRKQDRRELQSRAPGIVDSLRDQRAFPVNALTFARLFFSTEPAVVGLRADHQNEVCFVQLIEHPSWPALSGRAVQIAIEACLNPVVPKPLRKSEDLIPMGVRVVAVADKDGGLVHEKTSSARVAQTVQFARFLHSPIHRQSRESFIRLVSSECL